jgi:hypothetical protein
MPYQVSGPDAVSVLAAVSCDEDVADAEAAPGLACCARAGAAAANTSARSLMAMIALFIDSISG